MRDSTMYDMNPSMDAGTTALLLGAMGVFFLFLYAINALFMGMMFKKAGIPAWKAWVPVYSSWVFLELGEQRGWISLLLVLSLIPYFGIVPALIATVFLCIAAYRIGLNFGKEGWFVVLYIFLSLVWVIWLAIDKTAVWNPSGATAQAKQPSTPDQDDAHSNLK